MEILVGVAQVQKQRQPGVHADLQLRLQRPVPGRCGVRNHESNPAPPRRPPPSHQPQPVPEQAVGVAVTSSRRGAGAGRRWRTAARGSACASSRAFTLPSWLAPVTTICTTPAACCGADHLLAIMVKRIMGQVAADVDHFHGGRFPCRAIGQTGLSSGAMITVKCRHERRTDHCRATAVGTPIGV